MEDPHKSFMVWLTAATSSLEENAEKQFHDGSHELYRHAAAASHSEACSCLCIYLSGTRIYLFIYFLLNVSLTVMSHLKMSHTASPPKKNLP